MIYDAGTTFLWFQYSHPILVRFNVVLARGLGEHSKHLLTTISHVSHRISLKTVSLPTYFSESSKGKEAPTGFIAFIGSLFSLRCP